MPTLRSRLVLAIAIAGMTLGTAHAQAPAAGVDSAALKPEYKRPPTRPVENAALVELGRLLFWDPRVSASGKTSCASCHLPDRAWAVTDARSLGDSGRPTSRKSQPLLGMGHIEGPLGWDGRNASLEAQAKASISTGSMSMRQTDTPVKVEVIEARIRAIPEYAALFERALPAQAVDIDAIATAIAAFERTIEPGPAPFDRWIDGDEQAIPDAAKRGFAVFNSKANCSACHGGWRFTDDSFHDIGTTTTDRGRGNAIKDDETMQFAFKTPTLRSVALRPPYMHNASAQTLEDVMRHYEKGGIDRPSRSAAITPVELSDQERQDIIAFMQTLTGAAEGETPPKLPGMPK